MIIRGKSDSRRVIVRRESTTIQKCLHGDPTCDTKQGCGCYPIPKENARSANIALIHTSVQKSKPIRVNGFARFPFSQKVAIERSRTPYLRLACGHFVSKDVAILFSVFAPHIRDVFCETHDAFYRITKLKRRASYPVNPLF